MELGKMQHDLPMSRSRLHREAVLVDVEINFERTEETGNLMQ